MILLLVVIYITFISLGLPDSLFGTIWPVAYKELGVAESAASIFVISSFSATAIVSFTAGKFIRKFGTGKVTMFSILLTIVGMVGMAISPNVYIMLLFAMILGLGGGAIDTGLNSFVSLHYSSKYMNWLHCFWGIGVSISPLIMSIFLADGSWRKGYIAVAGLQLLIFIIVVVNRGLWAQVKENIIEDKHAEKLSFKEIMQKPAIKLSILSIGLYCGMEFLVGTWGASYMVHVHKVGADVGARWVALYFAGIMLGRLISGFVSEKLGDKNMIQYGALISMLGMLILLLPVGSMALFGFLLVGLGFGPIFPATIHSIPYRFGSTYSADITGYHMGAAYAVGFTVQTIFGFVATATSFIITPYVLLAICLTLFAVCVAIYKELEKAKQ